MPQLPTIKKRRTALAGGSGGQEHVAYAVAFVQQLCSENAFFIGTGKSRFRLLGTSAPTTLMLYYQTPLPGVRLLDPLLYQKCFYVYRNGLRESWFLGHCVEWVIWAPGTGPACVLYPVMNATCVTHFQRGNLSSLQFSMSINLYASTNWTGKTPRKEGFKYIFVLSIPYKLFWVFLLCILLVHKICSHGLSAFHGITRSRGTSFEANELITALSITGPHPPGGLAYGWWAEITL